MKEVLFIQLKNNLQTYKSQRDKLKNTAIMNAASKIEEDKLKLSQLQVSSSTGT